MNRIFRSDAVFAFLLIATLTIMSCGTGNISTNKDTRQRDKARNLRGGCCFTGETKVRMADGTEKPICELKVGDEVLSFNFYTGQAEPAIVQGLETVEHDNLVEYVFENFTLRATEDHPFFLGVKGWASSDPEATRNYFNFRNRGIARVQKGDTFYVNRGQGMETATLQNVRPVEGTLITYAIVHLNRNEAYFANNTLTGVEEITSAVVAVP